MASASGGGREPRNYDQYLKWLLTRAHDDFLALVAPGLIYRSERSPRLPAVPRYADLVWEVENQDGVAGLLHIELQTRAAGAVAVTHASQWSDQEDGIHGESDRRVGEHAGSAVHSCRLARAPRGLPYPQS